MHNVRAELSFIWAKWGYSPGDRTSDNSEKLLQRGKGAKINIEDFGEGEFNAITGLLYKRLSASRKGSWCHQEETWCFSRDEDAKIGIMKSVLENIYLKILFHQLLWGQSASLSTLNSLGGVEGNSGCSPGSGRGRWQLPQGVPVCSWHTPWSNWQKSPSKKLGCTLRTCAFYVLKLHFKILF